MNVKFYCLVAVTALLSLFGCSKEKIAPPDAYTGNKIESGMSWLVSNLGGEYTIVLKEEFARWAAIDQWQYRVLFDDEEIDAGTVAGTALKVTVPENYSGYRRAIVVEGLFPEKTGVEPKWTLLASSEQGHGFIEVNGVWWAPGNLMLKDGKFRFATNPQELGLYFKHMSCYGVLSEGTTYSGKCYTPAEKTVALADIPEKDGDPCMTASDGKWRLPSLYEMDKLLDNDWDLATENGVKGISIGGGKLFLPLAGGYNKQTGAIGYKNTNGAYWYSGEDVDGIGGMLIYLPDLGLTLSYNYGEYTGSVRCVRNTKKPEYVSHTPATLTTSAETEIQVVTTPGDLDEYTVSLVDGAYEIDAVATAQKPIAKITVPENTDIEPIVYTFFVNGEPTGKTITQPGLTNYGYYKSHMPTGTVPADAFTLTVNCTTDMAALNVEVKDDAELSLKAVASKANPSVKIAIPENTSSADRVLKIYVNGKNTGRTVTQEKLAGRFAVIWSSGYLTVKDSAYAFAGEQELGMYFKYKSRYGLTLDPTGKKYSGEAYGPAKEAKAFTDVNFEDVDPCTLVAPAGTWRMPTQDEWNDLLSFNYTWLMDKYRAYADKNQTIYITPSGSMNASGTSMMQPQWAKVWSTTQHVTDQTKYYTLIGTFSSQSGTFSCMIGTTNNQALMVRCVRDR